MTDVIAGNETIAKFMDIKVVPYQHYAMGEVLAIVPDEGILDYPSLTIYDPLNDWQWFMPAYKKYEGWLLSEPRTDVEAWKNLGEMHRAILDADLPSAHKALVKGIEFKNQMKEK